MLSCSHAGFAIYYTFFHEVLREKYLIYNYCENHYEFKILTRRNPFAGL